MNRYKVTIEDREADEESTVVCTDNELGRAIALAITAYSPPRYEQVIALLISDLRDCGRWEPIDFVQDATDALCKAAAAVDEIWEAHDQKWAQWRNQC